MISFKMLKCPNKRIRRELNSIMHKVNSVLNGEVFKQKLMAYVDEMDMSYEEDGTGITGPEMYEILKKNHVTFGVIVSKKFFPWSRTCGYYEGGEEYVLNYWYAKRMIKHGMRYELADTMVHEGVHAADEINPYDYFGHVDNEPEGKENTAPWLVGRIMAECFYEGI